MASSKHSSSLSSLNPELLEEIFRRAQAETLIRLKPTCMQFNSLISNIRFIYDHFDHSSERFIRTNDTTVRIMDPVTETRSDTPIPDEFQEPNRVQPILHCDGLILCIRRDHWQINQPRRPQIAIWNPLLRRVKWINPSQCLSPNSVYGFGYKSREEGYKILRFSNSWFKVLEGETQVEVYELENSSWRTLDHVEVDVRVDSKGVAVMGNMYWLAENKSSILGFSFTSETFKDVCSCPAFYFGDSRYLSCFREDRLSLCEGAEGEGVTFSTYGIIYEVEEGGLKNQTETETERIYGRVWYPIFCGHVYAPSLVPLP
ncbi:unnamed protein product [Eruca vesicaria subsp. sativa]|uniref:F-box domain-containing protein n=1 Tax=Eruca vesicaria subsp. sativa TaxID=29727 RepID=A0ABC8JTN1_ERUVS|nr:unnamed protein product [Eruca vesicaria subsp. sativa]